VDKGREPHPDPINAPQQAKEAFAASQWHPTTQPTNIGLPITFNYTCNCLLTS